MAENSPSSKKPGQRQIKQFEGWAKKKAITPRDELILAMLAAVKVASLDQLWRIFWPGKTRERARVRLSILINTYGLIDHLKFGDELISTPKADMAAYGLAESSIYMLSSKGRGWLTWRNLDTGPYPQRDRIIHDLLVAELRTYLEETVRQQRPQNSLSWYGENTAGYFLDKKKEDILVAPDGLGIIQGRIGRRLKPLPLFFEVEMGREARVRENSPISQKFEGYADFFTRRRQHTVIKSLPHFPPVLLIVTGSEMRLQNLVKAITSRSQTKRVGYALCLWEDLFRSNNFFTAPAWLLIKPNTKSNEILGADRNNRQLLLNGEWLRSLQ